MINMDAIEQLFAVSPRIALVLVLCVIGFWMKRSPAPNWTIPLVLMVLGAIGFTVMADIKDDDYTAKFITHNAIIGMLLGASSVGLHSAVRPLFPFLFPPKGHTEILNKKDVKEEKPCPDQ